MAQFELFLDDDNEVKFDVAIEGVGSGSVTSKLVFESRSGYEIGFDASQVKSDEINFLIPSLKGIMTEGSAQARLEVYIDDRRFVPLDMVVDLKKSIKVEAVVKTTRVQKSPKVSAILSENKSFASTRTVSKKRSSSLDDLITAAERK